MSEFEYYLPYSLSCSQENSTVVGQADSILDIDFSAVSKKSNAKPTSMYMPLYCPLMTFNQRMQFT